MIRDAEESNDEDPVAKRNKKKKKKSRKIHKSKDASSSMCFEIKNLNYIVFMNVPKQFILYRQEFGRY